MTNRTKAKLDETLIRVCEVAGIPYTPYRSETDIRAKKIYWLLRAAMDEDCQCQN